MAARAVVGLGGNLGDVRARFTKACAALAATPHVRVRKKAQLLRTRPHGEPNQPWFWNTALLVETELTPHALLRALLAIEARLGRTRTAHTQRWGPRPIDLDLLAYEETIVHDPPKLIVPHPRLAERRFALAPMAELWPDWRHPKLGRTAQELLARCPDPEEDIIPLGRW